MEEWLEVVYTPQTFAWINEQLDYPESRQYRIHLSIDGKTSLCRRSMHGWESDFNDFEIGYIPWLCKTCRQAALNRRIALKEGLGKNHG